MYLYMYFNNVIYTIRKIITCHILFKNKKQKTTHAYTKPSSIPSNVIHVVPLFMIFTEMPEKDEGTQAIWKSTFDNDYKELEEIGRLVPKSVNRCYVNYRGFFV